MADRGTASEGRTVRASEVHRAESTGALEQRVNQLERVGAGLQDTRQLEDRVVERVAQRVSNYPVAIPCDPPSLLVNAGRQMLPAALHTFGSDTDNTARSRLNPIKSWLLGEMYTEAFSILDMYC